MANGPDDDPPMSVVIDAALAHLIESEENIQEGCAEYDPETVRHLLTRQFLDFSIEQE